MKVKVQVSIERDGEGEPIMADVACFERVELNPATLGLTLEEGKSLLAGVQQTLVMAQATAAAHVEEHRHCPQCGSAYRLKGQHTLTMRTLFGKFKLPSQRYYCCSCQPQPQPQPQPELAQKKSFSPLAELLPERTTPELQYLQTKWAALMSYGVTTKLLEEVLPLAKHVSTATLSAQVARVADRAESELGEVGEEQPMFVEGCPAMWAALPQPDAPITVGLDGGYVRAREGKNRKAGCFEVIVGKSMPTEGPKRRFGYVNGEDRKPKRRLYELLKAQGMQENQQMIFISDGGDTVRDLPMYLNPHSEHLLDWFHIAMRITVLGQLAKGIPKHIPEQPPQHVPKSAPYKKEPRKSAAQDAEDEGEDEDELEEEEGVAGRTSQELIEQLERVKWYLWHGNVYMALQSIEELEEDAEVLAEQSITRVAGKKLSKAVSEFWGYINANQSFIVNYGDRYRNGETISSAFVESTVNEVISKRFEKKQSMRWTKRGVHDLLQVRVQVLDGELRPTYERWYPGMRETCRAAEEQRAA